MKIEGGNGNLSLRAESEEDGALCSAIVHWISLNVFDVGHSVDRNPVGHRDDKQLVIGEMAKARVAGSARE